MSVQDRAQAQLSQLDKEVSPPLALVGWHIAKMLPLSLPARLGRQVVRLKIPSNTC